MPDVEAMHDPRQIASTAWGQDITYPMKLAHCAVGAEAPSRRLHCSVSLPPYQRARTCRASWKVLNEQTSEPVTPEPHPGHHRPSASRLNADVASLRVRVHVLHQELLRCADAGAMDSACASSAPRTGRGTFVDVGPPPPRPAVPRGSSDISRIRRHTQSVPHRASSASGIVWIEEVWMLESASARGTRCSAPDRST